MPQLGFGLQQPFSDLNDGTPGLPLVEEDFLGNQLQRFVGLSRIVAMSFCEPRG